MEECWLKHKNATEFIVWLTINTIYDRSGEVYRRVALFSDITEKKQAEHIIWKQANYDPLTGLPNRRMLLEYLGTELLKSDRNHQHFALMFLDLDYFKEINDTLGHDVGDLLLVEAAKRLKACIRESDVVARLGGDEFTIVLSAIEDNKGVERVAQNILLRLAEPYNLGNDTAYITASIGITLYPDDASTIENLLKHADQAMYAAKDQGRNRFHYFTPSMQEEARYRMVLIRDLRKAVKQQEFEVYYQPIIDLTNEQVYKAEALIRWHHPERGLVSPAEFIPIAEDTGLIIDIGNWVFEQAAMQSAAWREKFGVEIQISINKSPIQFRDEGDSFENWIIKLQELNLASNGICVEITEGLLLDASMGVSEKLLAYRDAGIQVSLDDFGTGYSSLAYLKKFDIDYLKIDQSFTRNLESDPNDATLCEAIIVMAHKLGMKVIAEGVETKEQQQILSAAGCNYGQGYLFSKPVPYAEFEAKYLKTSEQRQHDKATS
uniref:EAL domain-containing protein n=1 Tax=Shewanella eurypsychrophilus TaxID=2593656 RepID=A0A7S9J0Q0_9GAMM